MLVAATSNLLLGEIPGYRPATNWECDSLFYTHWHGPWRLGDGHKRRRDYSSLQFTSPLEFNAIFRDGFTLRLELNGWSKIRDPVTAKFKHVTVIVTCTLLCCDDVTYVPALWNFQKADLEPYPYGKKYTTFSFPILGALASNICLRDAPTCSCRSHATKYSPYSFLC